MLSAYFTLLLSASAFLICIISIFYFRSYLRRRTSQERILAEMREEVNSILRSINETTDRDISLIEEREKKLKSLLEEIDKRLGVYVRELERQRGAEKTQAALQSYQELGKNRLLRPETESSPSTEDAPAFPLPRFRVKQEASAAAGSLPVPSSSERIMELAREGFAPPVIASRLGLSIAEVEFTTALFERRDAQ